MDGWLGLMVGWGVWMDGCMNDIDGPSLLRLMDRVSL